MRVVGALQGRLINAVIEAEAADLRSGDDAFWDNTTNYVETKIQSDNSFFEWSSTLSNLKHRQRFFNTSAQSLFKKYFLNVESLQAWNYPEIYPVVYELPIGENLFRARLCNSQNLLNQIIADPFLHVGPVPKEAARSGRMNAEGVPVFYGSLTAETCMAEMRPTLKSQLAVITVKTLKLLRVLDFSRLERSRGSALSYMQPNFKQEAEKNRFLSKIHSLIAQPVLPGHEMDYIITQAMAEYLSHVHENPFDGILFSSAQSENGLNIVIFPKNDAISDCVSDTFGIEYIVNSIKLFSTAKITYEHEDLQVTVSTDGDVSLVNYADDF